MNTQSISNNTTTESTINRFFNLVAATILIAMAAVNANAADAAAANSRELKIHNPYTVLGVQVRTHLLPQEMSSAYSVMEVNEAYGHTLFQEIVPCRFISTLDADQYPDRWGGLPFQINETRSYFGSGVMVEGLFVNPCSERIPN